MPHPDLVLELLAFLHRREPRSLFPLGSIRIADLPEHLRSDDLVNYCQHHSLVELSWIPKDAPDYSPETAGLRLSIGEKGAADLAEGRLLAEESVGSHPGDDLLRYLADRPDEMAAVIELPERFRHPSVLTVSDADGLIEFGARNHCLVGPVGKQELSLESGWNFSSVTGPNCKSMNEFLAEVLTSTDDERIRQHVHLTAKGRVCAARVTVDRRAGQVQQKPKMTATDWRDVKRRLLQLYDQGEPYTSIGDLAKRLGCAKATIQKAIKDSPKLKGWQARHTKAKGTSRASSLTKIVMDNAEQTREPDPAENAEPDDVDIVFARLIQEAQPEERAKLNVMTSEQRRQIVDLLKNDPDNYNRVLGRTP